MGIGGIGMSGIAKILRQQGYTISGCDIDTDQSNITELKQLGCAISHGHNNPSCADPSISNIVYSSAVPHNHPELVAARSRGVPTIARAVMLGELMRTRYSIAVAGAHGKTTTTSLISHILMHAGWDPTVIIGGKLKNIGSNAQLGHGDFIVAETDESDRSVARLAPTLGVLTNIDLEHLETYKNIEEIKETFIQFLSNIPFYGKAFVCHDNILVKNLAIPAHVKTISYSIDPASDIYARELLLTPTHSQFQVTAFGEDLGSITVTLLGRHNVLNSLAACAVALDVGIPFGTIAHALAHFPGIERRFSFNGMYQGAEIFDDYGHHPTEIESTLTVARQRAKKKLIVVFQPHRYTRTHALWDDFVKTLSSAHIDQLFITDIHPASEAPIDTITADRLTHDITHYRADSANITHYIPLDSSLETLAQAVQKCAQPGDLILLLGAGKINKLAPILLGKK